MVRVPWVVAIWRTPGGPGAGGGRPAYESAHVFPSEEAFTAATEAAAGRAGRWVRLFNGDPRPMTPDWKPGDFEYAADSVTWHGGAVPDAAE